MIEIKLTKGFVSVISDEDYDLSLHKWHAVGQGYAARNIGGRKNHAYIYLHRVIAERIIGKPIESGYDTDHIDGDIRNNQRFNLQVVTHAENNQKQKRRIDNTTGYRGVTKIERIGKWQAKIRTTHIGYFETDREAAIAYNKKALELFGRFAVLNEIQ